MEARTGTLEPTADASRRVAERFAHWRTAGSEEFFEALARHFAHLSDHPVLPLHFEYAVTANDRGRAAARRLAGLLEGGHRRGLLRRAAARVLDVGCAYGGFLVAFAEAGAKVTGIEKDERYVRLAGLNLREHGLDGEVVHGDAGARRPGFRGRFDLVIANDVLEHVQRPDEFLANVAAWLAPGGVAYFEIPNGAWPPYVGKDGHHQLFGLVLLDFAEASRYMTLLSPDARYDTYNYLGVADYRRLFAAQGLSFEVMPETLAAATVDGVLAQCRQLRAGLEAGLATVPEDLRALVRERVETYLARVDAAPRAGAEEQRAFLLDYGPAFWMALARRA
jgi:2-polyprenyl-3-methyl-5-hydroxy-6-metoxy-1,4-benzoquinol methylase